MERAVQQTDYDALSCRLSAIQKGYLPSPYFQGQQCHYDGYKELHLQYLNTLKSVSRRVFGKVNRVLQSSFPVMNFGTYLRTVSIDLELNRLLADYEGSAVQVLDLGGGSDLRMVPLLSSFPQLRFVDVDYRESTEVKSKVLWRNERLRKALDLEIDEEGSGMVRSSRYKLIACDLNNISETKQKLAKVTDPNVPTIVITECVLCYMGQDESKALINYITHHFSPGHWISYDPIGGSQANDRFGTIMQANLRDSRSLEMPTLMVYNSKEAYAKRFMPLEARVEDMWHIFEGIPPEEMKRLKSLQFLDEVEELKVMQTHYVLCKVDWKKPCIT